MKHFRKTGLLVLTGFLLSCASGSKVSTSFELKKYDQIKLKNGLQILMIKDDSLPYISMGLLVKSGYSQDPVSQSGLSTFLGQMIGKGTKEKNAIQMADELALIGGEMDTVVDSDFTFISASGLSNYQHELLDLYSDAILNPVFPGNEIKRLKRKTLAQIQKKIDKPRYVASRAFKSYLYGTHPYSNPSGGTYRDVRSFKKKHIVRHYLRYYRPNNALLAIVGNYDAKFVETVQSRFGTWSPRKQNPVVFPQVPKIEGVNVQLVHRPDLVQSQIRIGHKGIKRDNPDFLVVRVMNTALGGAFASRLNDRIRKDLGLTYSISSSFDARANHGPFTISTFTRNEKVGQTVRETIKVLKEYVDKGITEEELARVKGYLKGTFPRAIETPERLAFNLLALRYYKIKDDYLENYLINIDKITQNQVNAALKKYLDPNNLKVVVYSKKKVALPQLRKIGVVEVKPYKVYR